MLIIPPTGPIPDKPLLIGDVADLTGLSLRSIRHYEELGLVSPESRTPGGFRLFDQEAVERLRLVMILKILDLSLEEIGPIVDAYRDTEQGRATAEQAEVLATAQNRVQEARSSLEARLALTETLGRQLRMLSSNATCA